MSNDKTLATVKHGGCVQLPTSERARFEAWAESAGYALTLEDGRYEFAATRCAWTAWRAATESRQMGSLEPAAWVPPNFFNKGVVAATARRNPPSETAVELRGEYVPLYLSAQPSPGGQGDALVTDAMVMAALQAVTRETLAGVGDCDSKVIGVLTAYGIDGAVDIPTMVRAMLEAALAARQPVGQITDAEIDARLNALYREITCSGQHNGGMSGVAWDRAVYRMASKQPAQAVDPADPWRGLYSPDLMPKLDGVNLYHAAHPDLPSWPKDEDEERGIGPLITAQGFALEVVFGEYPDDDGEEVDYCAWLASWTPHAPAGLGWRLVCIQDTEDGPAAFYVRPLALIDSQAVGNG